jgi:hypothetical protein
MKGCWAMSEDDCHYIITETYDSKGELVAKSCSYVPWAFEPNENTKQYWAWLDERRGEKQ